MTHMERLEAFFKNIPPKYLSLIAADFAEEVLPTYEAFNKDSSVLVEAIAAARSGDPVRAKAAADAASAVSAHTASNAVSAAVRATAYAANAVYAAVADVASCAACAGYYAADAANSVPSAWFANAAKSKAKAEKRQVEVIKGWISKLKAEEPVLMAFYDVEDL